MAGECEREGGVLFIVFSLLDTALFFAQHADRPFNVNDLSFLIFHLSLGILLIALGMDIELRRIRPSMTP